MKSDQEAKVIIDKALDEIVRYTVEWLHPHFAMDLPAQPNVKFDIVSQYDAKKRTISLQREDFETESNYGIGHEVSHYLHHMTNPSTAGGYNHDYERNNLLELVADYGAFLFCSERHDLVRENKNKIIEQVRLSKTLSSLERIPMTPAEKIFSSEVHTGGCSAARFLIEKYEEQYLPRFATANVEEAKELLLKLGWSKPLFIPYSEMEIPHAELEIIIEPPEEISELKP